jgi:hypothetical protein
MRRRSFVRAKSVALLAAFGLIVGVVGFALADGGSTSKVHACVKKTRPNVGATRIVRANQGCRRSERAVHWPASIPKAPAPQFAEFYALMPADNAATVAAGAAVDFPQDGPESGSISSTSASTFKVGVGGTYRVSFVVPVSEAGQLVVALNDTEIARTVVGRATGTSQIVGELLLSLAAGDVLEVVNPADATSALTITPFAGGTEAASASLVIQKLG